ncbi:hypothetical protein V5N34_31950 [Streptomyces baarnensis]|uniref:hypothetical protein n=1 Tax=Streptomyces TaxID=1883 RepID=UPI0029AD6E73|nr:hypothetical protein [Streptomyces sp. ME02-6979.5a]MDX3342735.1 hypothetical protein [Streptomyces sp. ME02-6979.5a]
MTIQLSSQRREVAEPDRGGQRGGPPGFREREGRRWFRHYPHGADAVAAAATAADTARERTAQHLLAVCLRQLRQQSAARSEQTGPMPWTDRLSELAARPLNNDATKAAITSAS